MDYNELLTQLLGRKTLLEAKGKLCVPEAMKLAETNPIGIFHYNKATGELVYTNGEVEGWELMNFSSSYELDPIIYFVGKVAKYGVIPYITIYDTEDVDRRTLRDLQVKVGAKANTQINLIVDDQGYCIV